MINKEASQRYSARDCLNHPWLRKQLPEVVVQKQRSTRLLIQKQEKPQNDDERTIYEMLKNFRNGAKFKKEVMKVLINQMNEVELQHLKRVFQKIDVDNSGTITVEELRQALKAEVECSVKLGIAGNRPRSGAVSSDNCTGG